MVAVLVVAMVMLMVVLMVVGGGFDGGWWWQPKNILRAETDGEALGHFEIDMLKFY